MRVIIAGSRSIGDYELVEQAVADSGFNITEVVSGKAIGVDTLGEIWANEHGVPIKPFPANWAKYGRRQAGKIRNQQMADYADALIAVIKNHSSGSSDMLKRIQDANKPFYLVEV